MLQYDDIQLIGTIGFHCSGVNWGYLGPTFANEQIIGFHCSEPTGSTLGVPLPASKSLDFIALGLLRLLSGYICQRANRLVPLLWGHWGYLGVSLPTRKSLDSVALGLLGLPSAHLANEQIVRFHCSRPTRANLGLPLPTRQYWVS